ncbi:MAG: hypothetical protein CENE_03591 [Candidatus Celerinatantimonas neptuna]|nr:MAG: hypothetical protein CENE_03591 [Candidatus Celerinatantimonas neptuna]
MPKLKTGWPVSIIVIFMTLICQPWVNQLSWDRQLILKQDQLWRLLSGIFVHANIWHALMNIAALGLISLLFASAFKWHQWLILIISLTIIANSLLLLQTQTIDYVGLSGVLHGIVVYCALTLYHKRPIESRFILTGVVIKLILEEWLPHGLGDQRLIGMPVATRVHLFFSITAVLLFYLTHKFMHCRNRSSTKR